MGKALTTPNPGWCGSWYPSPLSEVLAMGWAARCRLWAVRCQLWAAAALGSRLHAPAGLCQPSSGTSLGETSSAGALVAIGRGLVCIQVGCAPLLGCQTPSRKDEENRGNAIKSTEAKAELRGALGVGEAHCEDSKHGRTSIRHAAEKIPPRSCHRRNSQTESNATSAGEKSML